MPDPPNPTAAQRLRTWIASPPRWLAWPARVATVLEYALGAIALVIIFVLVLVQAGQRYLPIEGWSWTGELARFSLVWLTFLVAGVLVSSDSHISIEMVDEMTGPRLRRLVRVVSCLIVAIIGVGLVAEAWELVQSQRILKSPAMRMPMSWLYAISMIGFVSIVLRALAAGVRYAVLGVPEPHHDDVAGVPTS